MIVTSREEEILKKKNEESRQIDVFIYEKMK